MTDERWPDDVSLMVNAGPEDGHDGYDIWHTGGPGGPWLTAISEEAARSVIAVVDEVHELRAENTRLRSLVSGLQASVPPSHPSDYGHEIWAEAIREAEARGRDAERDRIVADLRAALREADGLAWATGSPTTYPIIRTLEVYAERYARGEHREEGA